MELTVACSKRILCRILWPPWLCLRTPSSTCTCTTIAEDFLYTFATCLYNASMKTGLWKSGYELSFLRNSRISRGTFAPSDEKSSPKGPHPDISCYIAVQITAVFSAHVKLSLPGVKAHGCQNWLAGVKGLVCGSIVCRDKAVICRLHGERSSSEKENKTFRTFEYVASFCFSGMPVMYSRLQRNAPFGQHQESRSKVLFEPGEKKLC